MIINKKNIPDKLIRQLIADIKRKKELSDIDDSFVKPELLRIVSRERKIAEFLSSPHDFEKIKRAKKYKDLVKKTRATLRKAAGVFIEKGKLKELENIFLRHKSTKERAEIYPHLYRKIFHITGTPKSILDLGCGLNPLSYKFLGAKPFYYAVDISSSVVDAVNDFFMKNKIKGYAKIMNLREIKNKKLNLPKAEICFMFKLLDSIELEKGHKLAEKLIKDVPCQWIVASFSKKTLSGKKMRHPYRGWIEQLCRRLGYFYEIIDFENEIFYIIKKI